MSEHTAVFTTRVWTIALLYEERAEQDGFPSVTVPLNHKWNFWHFCKLSHSSWHSNSSIILKCPLHIYAEIQNHSNKCHHLTDSTWTHTVDGTKEITARDWVRTEITTQKLQDTGILTYITWTYLYTFLRRDMKMQHLVGMSEEKQSDYETRIQNKTKWWIDAWTEQKFDKKKLWGMVQRRGVGNEEDNTNTAWNIPRLMMISGKYARDHHNRPTSYLSLCVTLVKQML